MELLGQLFTIIFTNPLTNLLVAFYKVLILAQVPYALGFSIVLVTASIKLILYPFMSQQIKSSAKMQQLAPHMNAIKEKHKNDKQLQQAEMMKLYKEHNINPATGCLPMLIQFPILIALYRVLESVVSVHSADVITKVNKAAYFSFLHLDKAWQTTFFGIPLSQSPMKLFTHMPLIVLVPIITGLLQFVLAKMMIPEGVKKEAKNEEKKTDFQTAFQSQSLFIFPLFIGYLSFTFPFGLALYWNTYTIFGILQQYLLTGPGGMRPWFAKIGLHGSTKNS